MIGRKKKQATDSAETPKRRWRITRRGFLIGAGGTAVAAGVALQFGLPYARLKIAEGVDSGNAAFPIEAAPTLWFDINDDNTVTLHSPKVEMGQGIHTALKQIAAEELMVDWDQMQVVQANTMRGPNDGFGTGGSASVTALYTPLREAGATLREMMRLKAAEKLGVAASALTVESGVFSTADGMAMSYAEVVAGVTEWDVPEDPPALMSVNDFRFVGKSMPRVDFESKLTGEAVYGYDERLPDMLYGAVVRPSTIEGKLISAEPGEAPDRPGVVQVVIEDDLVGVVATSRIEAERARGGLDLTWDDGKAWQQDEILALTTVGVGKATDIQKVGRVEAALQEGTVVSAEYRSPMAAHAHLEPQAALVDVQDDKVVAFVSSQSPDAVRGDIADAIGIDVENVELRASYLGGGFGRKLNANSAIEAAKLSKAVGRPVSIGWNRREEFRNGYLRPPTHSRLTASLMPDGTIAAIDHQQASGDVAFPFFPAVAAAVLGADFGAWRGSMIQYGVENKRTTAWRSKLPLATGWWRGLGLMANTFAVESFMDELADAAGQDPLAFRLAHLGEQRVEQGYRRVLEAVAERADWGSPLPEGWGRGIAASVDVRTFCAQVADISITSDNQIKVERVYCAIDPGVIINPDGVLAQTQGSIIMGLSSTFFEEITVKDGRVEATNFDRYPLITMKEAPEIDVVMLEGGDEPNGMGEPPMGPIAAAVANAVFNLTGQRIRELPLRLA